MDVSSTAGLMQLATVIGEDVLVAAKILEPLGLQNNKALLSRLSTFQIILDDVYGISSPNSDDYASRRDLIRIFNDIAREIYGDNATCPVVENFGSFLMNMFSAKSDLDLSINFSDKLFEADRMAKKRTLRKFAKKFYALRSKGHITTVELILSARVPVLKVTDSGSGIECDLSVGNRDGIDKSHIVFLISGIDERFRQLSFMMKAWAKAHDINSSKDGTLNSLSLILLVAFHLQTRDIPILPPFSAIFKDGTDPAAVKRTIPSFLNFGERNKESLAELFVSLLVKLISVEKLWSRGLSASTYEGSWIRRNSKATGYMSIEDFTDRSQNTARAVKSAQMNKIYSCIHRSVELIRFFTEGIVDATQLKKLLFDLGPPIKTVIPNLNYSGPSKTVCSNPNKKIKKRLSQGDPVKGQRPGKQGKHGYNLCSMEAPGPSGIEELKNQKPMSGRETDPASSNTPSSFQGLDMSQGTLTPNLSQGKKNHSTQGGPTEWQRCDNNGKRGLLHCTMGIEKRKSMTGRDTDPVSSDTPKGLDKLKETPTPNPSQKQKKHPIQRAPAEGQRHGKTRKKKKKSRSERNTDHVTSKTPASFQGLGKSQETLPRSFQPHSVLPIPGSGGYRSQRAYIEPLNNATPTFRVGQPCNNQSYQGSGVSGLQRNHVGSSLPANQPSLSNPPIVQVSGGFRPNVTHLETLRHAAPYLPQRELVPFSGYGGFRSDRAHVETMKHAVPSYSLNQPYSHSNLKHSQDYGGFRSESYHVETSNQPFLHSNPQLSQDCRGFRSERHHVEILNQPFSHSNNHHSLDNREFRSRSHHDDTSRHAPNFPSGPWVSVSNQPIQGSGGLLPRMHVETPNLPVSKSQSPYLANLAPGFGPERGHAAIINHANTHFQPASYTLGPRPNSFMPPHQSYLPSVSHRETVGGLQRPLDPRQAAAYVPSEYNANMHPYQSL